MFLVKKIFLEKYPFMEKIAICIKMLEKFIKFYTNFDVRKKLTQESIEIIIVALFVIEKKKRKKKSKKFMKRT